jgi:hypothetical protein
MTSLALGTGILDLNYKSAGSNYNTYRVQVLSDSTIVIFLNNGAQAYGSRTYTEVMRISPTGLVSFNGVALSARLNLSAGTTTIAPLSIPSGTLRTTPSAGSIEADSNWLYYTDNSTVRRVLMSILATAWTTHNIPYFSSSSALTSSSNLSYNGTTLSLTHSSTTSQSLLNLLTSSMTTTNETRCLVGRTTTNCANLFFNGTIAGIKNNNRSSIYLGLDNSGDVIANTTLISYSISPFFSTSVTASSQWVAIGSLLLDTNQTANFEIQTKSGRTYVDCRDISGVVSGSYWSNITSDIIGMGIDLNGNLCIGLITTTWIDVYAKTSGVWIPASSYVTSLPWFSVTFTSVFAVNVASSTTSFTPLSINTTDLNYLLQITGGVRINGIGQIKTGNVEGPPTSIASGDGGQGCRIVLRSIANSVPYSIGSNTTEMFLSVHDSTHSIVFYTSTSRTTSFQNGTMITTGDVTAFGSVSDRRLKENIEPLGPIDIKAIRPVKFTWKNDIFNENKRGQIDVGFIAQEIEEVIPEIITNFKIDNLDYKAIKYEKLVPYLVKTIQDLTLRVELLESKLQNQ